MITVGVDAHKRMHVALALDDAGQELGHWRGLNSAAGWQSLARWAGELGCPRQWAIEGAWNYGRGLAQHLVAGGETVFEVNARWTALGRRSARKPGKTDKLDARAVALLARQEAQTLPRVLKEDTSAILALLTTEREGAIGEATRVGNQIHALLLQLDPEYHGRLANIRSRSGLEALESYTASDGSLIQQERAAAVRRLAVRLRLVLSQAEELAGRIEAYARTRFSPLTRLCGVNLLTAGMLAGILGPGCRFSTDAEMAAYAGAAPLEASSAGVTRHRLNLGGNRRLNAILYRIALTQAHYSPAARAYLQRRMSEGKTRREAVRALKRYIIRAVWRLWQDCQAEPIESATEHAA